uniref:Retrotransposon protein, putative, Ty3-gypsy subclass, expressed n=2 Tax=Oryza sativa subsp. japonica TaxID=39947 RepID=Q94HR0_ORYSJ|nr:Hypothetical protein [Oryza sativa Japonica Group]AAP52959.1 retrotransposon protein, putative, Ty3-gypsy subclass, expressed [Oryza sativa Japonica Group]
MAHGGDGARRRAAAQLGGGAAARRLGGGLAARERGREGGGEASSTTIDDGERRRWQDGLRDDLKNKMREVREREGGRSELGRWPKAATMAMLTGARGMADSGCGFGRLRGGRGGARGGEHNGVDGAARRGG